MNTYSLDSLIRRAWHTDSKFPLQSAQQSHNALHYLPCKIIVTGSKQLHLL